MYPTLCTGLRVTIKRRIAARRDASVISLELLSLYSMTAEKRHPVKRRVTTRCNALRRDETRRVVMHPLQRDAARHDAIFTSRRNASRGSEG